MEHTQGTYNKGKKIWNSKKGTLAMLKGQIKAKEKEIKRLKAELDAKRKELLQMDMSDSNNWNCNWEGDETTK